MMVAEVGSQGLGFERQGRP